MRSEHTTPRRARRTRRAAAIAAAVAALVVVPVASASAHVHVVPASTVSGASTTMTFRVPNESDTASTTGLTVTLPTTTPLISVSVRPVPGWTATVTQGDLPSPVVVGGTTITKAPARVTWTATDPSAAIGQGQFQEFEISAGPLPAAGTTLVFPAAQTYSDGTVVDWDQVATDGGDEPEHPAPAFTVTAADEGTAGTATSDTTARALGGAGVVLGAVAVLLAAGALVRRRTVSTGPRG